MAKPKWNTDGTIRAGVALRELAVKYREALEPRLPAGLIDGLSADVDELRTDAAAAGQTRVARKEATGNQNDAIAAGMAMVAAIRAAVRHAYAGQKTIQTAFGVGGKAKAKKVSSIVEALEVVLKAADADPERIRGAGVLPADVEQVRAALASLAKADDVQEGKKVSAKSATAKRAATQFRVEMAMDKLVGAAHVAFHGKDDLVEQFVSLLPTASKRKARAATPKAGASAS